MSAPVSAVVFAMAERGHFRRMLPVIEGLSRAGVATHVFTDRVFCADVERAGGRFLDLFAGRPLAAADSSSVPIPSRFVTFAGRFGDAIAQQAAGLRPSLVVHDTFAVIGRVVAHQLGLPRVNVCACHNLAPAPTMQALRGDPRVRTTEECLRAVDVLRERYGMPDASPFSYIDGVSQDLNLYCEPPQYLRPEERAPFEPIEFFGSLWPSGMVVDPSSPSAFRGEPARPVRVYASFGCVIWRYYQDAALGALRAISLATACRRDADVLVSLGGAGPRDQVASLQTSNFHVVDFCDQWRVLGEASLYVTHQGLNSTHEAIYQRVPMVSYPFFSDQPGLADRCQEFGIAVPLTAELRGEVTAEAVHGALDSILGARDRFLDRLDIARDWELQTMAGRPAIVDRMLRLVG